MKIKLKLSIGLGILFLLIIILMGVGLRYIQMLSNDTENILVANYNTIDYTRQMLNTLDEDLANPESELKFKSNLVNQQNNITEVGEKELTNKLAKDFHIFKTQQFKSNLSKEIRKDLTDIMLLNMQAIQGKSLIADKTAKSASTIITLTGTVCCLIAFTLLLNLPGNIANPIKELTESIKEIAAKNYTQRVHFESHNEFGELANSFNTMAQKLEEYSNSNLAKLMMEKKRIETLINNMHDPVIGLDENRKIIFINNEALNIIGLNLNEVIGKKVDDVAIYNDLIRSLIQDNHQKDINSNLEKNPIKIYANGKESYFNKESIPIQITPTAENISKHIGDVILLQDITPFKELDVAKTNFIATVSHELKTPISSIILSLDLLENEKTGALNESQKQLMDSIKEDTNRLLKITSELLNMTQVEAGKIQLHPQQADPKTILQFAINANKMMAEDFNIQIETICNDQIPFIYADIDKTIWVLTNIISNAIRYSYSNSKIIVKVEEDLNSNIYFSVQDFGKGIEPKFKDKIFDRYFQVPGSSKSGTGLGLAISKEFIEAQGGKISVQSEIGIGSTFTIYLAKV
jgi:PAS domain S-box-containing protein